MSEMADFETPGERGRTLEKNTGIAAGGIFAVDYVANFAGFCYQSGFRFEHFDSETGFGFEIGH